MIKRSNLELIFMTHFDGNQVLEISPAHMLRMRLLISVLDFPVKIQLHHNDSNNI